jgi:glycosyltransferase involved in cell wall biosynthesis
MTLIEGDPMARNLLLINHYAGSLCHGMEFRPYYLAREWVRQGHHVTIAAASHSHLRQQTPVFRGPVYEETIDGIRYVWLKTPRYRGNGWKRAINIFAFVAQLFRWQKLLSGGAALDAVIASSTYPLDIYPARRIALRHQAKLIFEVHDLWPLTPVELGRMSPGHPFIRIMQRAEDYAYRHADRVACLLPKAGDYMVRRGMRPEKFACIPNGVDVTEWRSFQKPLDDDCRQRLRQLRRNAKFVIGYAGGMGLANALDDLIDAAVLLRNAPVAFALVGQGPEKNHLQQRVTEHALKNVAILPCISKASVPAFLSEIDAAFLGWKRCSLYRFGISPNKLMDYMMAAKPVIHAIEAANDLVAETCCGISVAPEDPQQIAAAVTELMSSSRRDLQQMGERGRAYVERHHDYRELARRFIHLIDFGDPALPSEASSSPLADSHTNYDARQDASLPAA